MNSIVRTTSLAAMAVAIALPLLGASVSTAQADDYRWRHRHWDRDDWRRAHPHVYIGPSYPQYYSPPPVVYAPPVYPPTFSLGFSF
ncbi:MAG: hypothetical protein IT562_16420 [Alphaproteobacteria bacterium]|nr:hypothetical protein [Alphaproteobacteria bacterium]